MTAFFPIVLSHKSKQPEHLGAGCYISETGLFVTATHVMVEALKRLDRLPFLGNLEGAQFGQDEKKGLCLYHKNVNGKIVQRLIKRVDMKKRPTGELVDICIGSTYPLDIYGDKVTYDSLYSMAVGPPAEYDQISSFQFKKKGFYKKNENYYFHFKIRKEIGKFNEIDETRKMSGWPYCRVNLKIPPGASGAPVFDSKGRLWAISSMSEKGKLHNSWTTPILPEIENIVVHELEDDVDRTGQELIEMGIISAL